jgi:S1-C subfamily serine protease
MPQPALQNMSPSGTITSAALLETLMRTPRCCFFLAFITLAGCQNSGTKPEAAPETPPPEKGPDVSPDAVLRPYFRMPDGTHAAGTAFVVKDKAGKLYMLTAAHLMDNDAEWGTVKGVILQRMAGGEVAQVKGRPVFLGKSFTDAGDTSKDLVVWPLADGSKAVPLTLAAGEPRLNEWVWAVGQEQGASGPAKMYRCKVTGEQFNGLTLLQHDRFQMRGFSGGAVVNERGEVVGTLLGGQAPAVVCMKAASLRKCLADAKVELP